MRYVFFALAAAWSTFGALELRGWFGPVNLWVAGLCLFMTSYCILLGAL
jgi:hypothetical protein